MQNPNISNAGHRSQTNLLDARSLSPSIHMMQGFHDVYQTEMPAQQFYNSMPHVSEPISERHFPIRNENHTKLSV